MTTRNASLALTFCIAVTLVCVFPAVPSAQVGGGYDLSWNTVDGGGGTSQGGGYTLSGTIGQHDAGRLTGGVYALSGGFWSGVGQASSGPNYDLNNSGLVESGDLLILYKSAATGGAIDFNNDGVTGIEDLYLFGAHWMDIVP